MTIASLFNLSKVDFSNYIDRLWPFIQSPEQSQSSDSPPRPIWSRFLNYLGVYPQTSGAKAPIEVQNPYPHLWALIIGINDYINMPKLRGAVPDADAMNEYLESVLQVPKGQIFNLRNATRSEIIAGFKSLRDNSKIEHQDPILIYYAGHGGEVPSNDKIKTQTLIPADYTAEDIRPIPDRTVAALINGISKKHGNNIISELWDGKSSTDKYTVRACELSPKDVPDDLDEHIYDDFDPGTRGLGLSKGFATLDMNSHVLLAAYSANELALEDRNSQNARGRFTTALLELLRTVQPDLITYNDVLSKMPRIEGQNPQCEGYYKKRILFDSKVRPPICQSYEVNHKPDSGEYVLEAGQAHGITDGAEFTLYRNTEAVRGQEPLGVLIARDGNIRPFTTSLELIKKAPMTFENPAIAIQTRAGASQDLLVYFPSESRFDPVFDAIAQVITGGGGGPFRIKPVQKAIAKLEIVAVGDQQFAFNVLEERATKHGLTRMPQVVEADVGDLHRILRAASHYHYHLNHNHPNESDEIMNLIDIEFFPVEVAAKTSDKVRHSRGGENMHREGRIEFVADGLDTKYGMTITNNSSHSFHFSCLFFDHTDFSIGLLSEVDTPTHHQKDHSLMKDGGKVELGHGESSIPPFDCDFPYENVNVTIGFFKFYFSTEVLDLSHVPQENPFPTTRGFKLSIPRLDPVWGAILIPVVIHKGM